MLTIILFVIVIGLLSLLIFIPVGLFEEAAGNLGFIFGIINEIFYRILVIFITLEVWLFTFRVYLGGNVTVQKETSVLRPAQVARPRSRKKTSRKVSKKRSVKKTSSKKRSTKKKR